VCFGIGNVGGEASEDGFVICRGGLVVITVRVIPDDPKADSPWRRRIINPSSSTTGPVHVETGTFAARDEAKDSQRESATTFLSRKFNSVRWQSLEHDKLS